MTVDSLVLKRLRSDAGLSSSSFLTAEQAIRPSILEETSSKGLGASVGTGSLLSLPCREIRTWRTSSVRHEMRDLFYIVYERMKDL